MSGFIHGLSKLYFKYTLCSAIIVLGPWERCLFNSLLMAFIAMASYTTYLYLPGHLIMLSHYFDYMLGSDSGVATATVPSASLPEAPHTGAP